MGLSVVRFELEGAPTWGVISNNKIHRITQPFAHQRDLLKTYFDDPKAFASLIDERPLEQNVPFLSPLLESTQLFAQGLNYASHREESGIDEVAGENLIFSKASSSSSGPNDPIVRPKGCELLDYEIELGVVLKKDIAEETEVTEHNLHEYVGALVLCNDVSARDFMFGAPMLQWFKGKGQRTFCPLGPVLYLLDEPDFAQFYELELTLKLNGEVKQQATTGQLIHKPPKTITEISAFANLSVGDCILTGTPGGVLAGHSPKAGLAIVMNLTNDQKRREKFVAAQKKLATFLAPGDKLELSIRSQDGSIDLGTQENEIIAA